MGRILANFSLLMDMEGLLPVSHHSDFLFFFACCKELFLDGYVTWNDTCNDDVSNLSVFFLTCFLSTSCRLRASRNFPCHSAWQSHDLLISLAYIQASGVSILETSW